MRETARGYTRSSGIGVAALLVITAFGCGPRIDGFQPRYGPPGTEVSITGSRLASGGTPSVELGGIDQSTLISVGATEIRLVVSEDAVTGPFNVRNSRGSATSEEIFDVVANANDPDGAYTFGGVDPVQPAKVDPSLTDQEVLIGLMRARWATPSGAFAAFEPDVDAAFDRMNDFWREATFERASFAKRYLATSIIDLPKSNDFYYHAFQQRDIRGSGLPANVTFASDETLRVISDGQDIEIDFAAGTFTLAEIEGEVVASIVAADPSDPGPTFDFDLIGNQFRISSTHPGETQGKLELEGGAIPVLGFGAESLYDLGDGGPIVTVFGAPIDADAVVFPSTEQLTITTLGSTTDVTLSGTMTVAEVVTAIEAAFPGEAQQQPFAVSSVADPADGDRRFLVFQTNTSEDPGVRLMVSGSARTALGLDTAGVLRSYEPEVFRGYGMILDGFNAHAAGLPAGTNLDDVFGNARMFVGVVTDNTNFRAHHSAWTFDIQGETYEVNYFAERIRNPASMGAVFAHETGHALGLPDLYRDEPWQLGNPPGNWDVMACSFCDAHPVAWLKSRHHRGQADQGEAWIDSSRVRVVAPPPAMETRNDTVILTPVDSPWVSSNPFAASHPGVPLAHSLELVPTDPKDVFTIENRQQGPYGADHLGDPVDFSTSLPGEGVIMYQGRRSLSGIATFLPVNFLSPVSNPLDTVGESFEHIITNLNKVVVTIGEKLTNPDASAGNPSFSYLTNIIWGQGSFFDLAIREWDPPPWESPDIWVDSDAENGWDAYTYHDDADQPILNGDNVAVNRFNRLYARVRNLGDVDVVDDVEVIWRVAIPQMVGGDVETELGRVTIAGGIPAKSEMVTPPFQWRPTSSNEEHVCLRAEIVTVSGELNGTLNNSAQENITQWFSQGSSPFAPVSFEVLTRNPFDDRTIQARLYVPEVPQGWSVTVEDVEFRLPPSGTLAQQVTVKPYLDVLRPQIRERGFIPEFAANIEAQTPIGDRWIPFGGTTAIVHPVNRDSRITLEREPASGADGVVTLGGTLATSGVQNPPLADREIHLRFQPEGGERVWVRSSTDSSGHFVAELPQELLVGRAAIVQAFYGGGRGVDRTRSPEVQIKLPRRTSPVTGPDSPDVPGAGGGVVVP